jgi:aryl-alcohol dehydrogenase-like predicted oxidoreductase
MEYRALGATGLLVSALGFGGNDLGRDRRRGITAETLRTIAAALDHGVTLFDTANSYVSGDSERMLGHALAGRRQDIVLCSKAGHGFWASLPVQRLVGPLNRQSSRNFRPSALETAVAARIA